MVNAVVLAGGKEKDESWSSSKEVFFKLLYLMSYGKAKIPGSYKSFINVDGEIEGVKKKRPCIEYILHALDKSDLVEKVAIVTDKRKLEETLDLNIKNYMKKSIAVQQVGSIKENALAGYSALGTKGQTLFITGDSPKTTAESIEEFLEKCSPHSERFDVIYPLVGKRVHYKFDKIWKRRYIGIVDDTTGNKDKFKNRYGVRQFRITSMILANPENIENKDAIDEMYSIRNLALPQNWFRACEIGFKDEIIKILKSIVFRKEMLKMSDIERKMSSFLETRFKFVELDNPGPSFDLDDMDDDKRIEKTNGYEKIVK